MSLVASLLEVNSGRYNGPMPATTKPRTKTVIVFGSVLLAFLFAWLLAAYQLFYSVQTPTPKKADAVVMLGGASEERMLDAMMIRSDIKAPYLVLSNTNTNGNSSADDYCGTHSNKKIYPDVICFTPKRMDTRGEAVALADLTTEHGWKDLIVVTSSYHIERAGLLMDQCVSANVTMSSTSPQFIAWQWLRRFVIESGGLMDVKIHPQCTSKNDKNRSGD